MGSSFFYPFGLTFKGEKDHMRYILEGKKKKAEEEKKSWSFCGVYVKIARFYLRHGIAFPNRRPWKKV